MGGLWLSLALYAVAFGLAGGCTVLLAARGATVDGSTLTSHTNDGEGTTDGRLFRVPAMDHPPLARRCAVLPLNSILVQTRSWGSAGSRSS